MKFRWLLISVCSVIIVGSAHGSPDDDCRLHSEHGAMTFPVDRLSAESRCLLADVVDHPSASGVLGPHESPIGIALYGYLLDHPIITALLMQRMGMGSFQITARGSNRYWVDDGDGAEGMLSLLFEDAQTRIYFIDGRHRSTLFPTIQARTAVFLRVTPGPATQGGAMVQSKLASYTRFEDGMLSKLMRLFQPLVTRAVNRTLDKEFTMTDRLGLLIAEQPQRVLQEAAGLSEADPDERQSLLALLRAEISASHPADRTP